MTTIGPHLLGRRPSERDPRDEHYLAASRLELLRTPTPDASLLDMTVREAVDAGYLSSWAGVRAFWRWLKAWLKHPEPTPVPDPAPAPSELRRQRWNVAYLLDQGDTPHCTGFGSAHWGISDPVNSSWSADAAHDFYYREKELDGEPREENGSTVRTAGKVLREQGRVAEYVWIARVEELGGQQLETLSDWLLHHGPVILGIDWYEGMFEPSAAGVIRPTGDYAGGHCLLAVGIDLDARWTAGRRSGTGLVELANSWGTSWGVNGHAFVPLEDLQDLLDAQGEAMAGLELAVST